MCIQTSSCVSPRTKVHLSPYWRPLSLHTFALLLLLELSRGHRFCRALPGLHACQQPHTRLGCADDWICQEDTCAPHACGQLPQSCRKGRATETNCRRSSARVRAADDDKIFNSADSQNMDAWLCVSVCTGVSCNRSRAKRERVHLGQGQVRGRMSRLPAALSEQTRCIYDVCQQSAVQARLGHATSKDMTGQERVLNVSVTVIVIVCVYIYICRQDGGVNTVCQGNSCSEESEQCHVGVASQHQRL